MDRPECPVGSIWNHLDEKAVQRTPKPVAVQAPERKTDPDIQPL